MNISILVLCFYLVALQCTVAKRVDSSDESDEKSTNTRASVENGSKASKEETSGLVVKTLLKSSNSKSVESESHSESRESTESKTKNKKKSEESASAESSSKEDSVEEKIETTTKEKKIKTTTKEAGIETTTKEAKTKKTRRPSVFNSAPPKRTTTESSTVVHDGNTDEIAGIA